MKAVHVEVLEVPNENGNRDIINRGMVGALLFDIERPATHFLAWLVYQSVDGRNPAHARWAERAASKGQINWDCNNFCSFETGPNPPPLSSYSFRIRKKDGSICNSRHLSKEHLRLQLLIPQHVTQHKVMHLLG